MYTAEIPKSDGGLTCIFPIAFSNFASYAAIGTMVSPGTTAGDARLFVNNKTPVSCEFDWTKSNYNDRINYVIIGY